VYSRYATEEQRRGLKKTLEKEIRNRVHLYERPVSGKKHTKQIEAIARRVNEEWGSALIQRSIPIGVVQKAFNLHLKLLWCLDRIPEPPHCPVDKFIIDKLPVRHRKSWTRIREIQVYNALISELRKLASKEGMTLARWELETYEKP